MNATNDAFKKIVDWAKALCNLLLNHWSLDPRTINLMPNKNILDHYNLNGWFPKTKQHIPLTIYYQVFFPSIIRNIPRELML